MRIEQLNYLKILNNKNTRRNYKMDKYIILIELKKGQTQNMGRGMGVESGKNPRVLGIKGSWFRHYIQKGHPAG